jgi:hypothetical protein
VFNDQGLGFRVKGWNFGYRAHYPSSGFQTKNVGCRVEDLRFMV